MVSNHHKEVVMNVMIGIDPHKASHTAVALDGAEDLLSCVKVRATSRQVDQLINWAECFEKRTWAIESAGGIGYLLAQQLVAQGEEVLDVPATLASRIRVLATERSNKNDPNDAHSIALPPCAPRGFDPWSQPITPRCSVCWLSATTTSGPSGPARSVVSTPCSQARSGRKCRGTHVSDAEALLSHVSRQTPAQQMRFDLVLELLDDVRRLDAQTKESHRRIKIAVKASGTSVTTIYGVGPILAAGLIGYSGDIRRFANRDAYASYNGTAPIELSSGGRVVHRLSRRGNRKLNHNIHMAAITQIRNPGTQGRNYFERKVAEGKTKKEAVRSLKRQVSNAVYSQLLLDAR